MFTKRRLVMLLLAAVMMFTVTACGSKQVGDTENSQEPETEKIIEILDATDILTKVWNEYEVVDTDGNIYNDRFDIMGGHFESAVMNMPAKYDLNKNNDLTLMYCVPQSAIEMIDDAATMVHLMKASTFTAGAYHVTDTGNIQAVVDGIKTQTLENHWLDGFPDKVLIVTLDNQYVITAIGTQEVVENFENVLEELFEKRVSVQINENIR